MPLKIARLPRHPLTWLLPLFPAVWAALRKNQFLVPGDSPDTLSYDLVSRSTSLAEALSSVRTLGYPVFLRLLRPFSEDYALAPTVHLVLFFAAVVLFWFAVYRYSGSKWLAFAWALPLAYPCNLAFVRWVQPDFLGPTLATAAVAAVILVARKPSSRVAWLFVTLTVFCAYQMRPDNLFLVVLTPIWGGLLLLGRRISDGRRLLRMVAGLAAATVLPLVAFMALRWTAVGQFGLVSFGGYNLVGITASFLDEELVEELDGDSRLLAAEILEGRRARNYRPFGPEEWTRRFYQQYSPNVWRVAEPIARRELTDAPAGQVPPLAGEAVFTINRAFATLSRDIVIRRPLLYVKWVYDSLTDGVGMTFQCPTFSQLMTLLVLSIPVLLIRMPWRDSAPGLELEDRALRMCVLAYVAVSYFLAKLLLIVLVSVPYDRHVLPAMAFLPCVLAAGLFELWRRILAPPTEPRATDGTAGSA